MGEGPSQIEDHIRATRRQLEGNLQELEHKVKDAANWRVQFGRHPGPFLSVACAGGMLLGSMGHKGRTARNDAERSGDRERSTCIQARARHGPVTSELWKGIKEGLMAAAASQIVVLLEEFLPSFRGHGATLRRGPHDSR